MTALETRFDTILPTLATKGDISAVETKVSEVETRVVRWVAGIGIASVTVMISVMSFLLTRIDTKPLAAQQQAPIIINVPQPAAAPAPQAVPVPPAAVQPAPAPKPAS